MIECPDCRLLKLRLSELQEEFEAAEISPNSHARIWKKRAVDAIKELKQLRKDSKYAEEAASELLKQNTELTARIRIMQGMMENKSE